MPLQVFCAGHAVLGLAASRFCTLANILGSTAPLFYPAQLLYVPVPLASRVGDVHYQAALSACLHHQGAPTCHHCHWQPCAKFAVGNSSLLPSIRVQCIYVYIYNGFGTVVSSFVVVQGDLVTQAASQLTVEFKDVPGYWLYLAEVFSFASGTVDGLRKLEIGAKASQF